MKNYKSYKTYLGFAPYILLLVITIQSVIFGLYGHIETCISGLVLAVISTVALIIYNYNKKNRIAQYVEYISSQLEAGSLSATRIDIPMLAVKAGKISWYNTAFKENVVGNADCMGESANLVLPDELLAGAYNNGTNFDLGSKSYRFYSCECKDGTTLCYFIDRTDTVKFKTKFENGRPVAAYITVDNIDELLRGTRDSDAAQISSAIEKRIEIWSTELNAICRKVSQDRFILVTDEIGLKYMIDTRFDILDKVKTIDFGEKGKATLSIGVGHSRGSFSACEEYARQALDMALGRGGDQAAIKDSKDFEFFGGTSTTVSKRSKVRTRMVASALTELINASENVLIMGHRFADFDSFGACYGLYRTAVSMGKQANIVLNESKCLCNQLSDYVCESFPDEKIIVSPETALGLMNMQTLLIITDTHRPSFLESTKLYESASTVVVIDHHRKTVDFIDNAVIFYHEPYASSACEMVTELLQYMTVKIGRAEAEALMTGIMLDTRNYVLNTGVRTFEASAFLKSCGANTVTVKGMFQNSIDVYRERSSIVARADIFEGCAISSTEEIGDHVRIACSQAADDMLGIENVKASFVVFISGNVVNISARSLGKVNVQLIMEELGGGGHLTMAACQLDGLSMNEAIDKLRNAIRHYNQVNKQ